MELVIVIIESTELMLKLLCTNYNEGKIDLFTFCLHAKMKVLFLKEYVSNINSEENRKKAFDIIDECESILCICSSLA